ncbi:hypothetical protein [Rhodococcus erythropolis]|uniref:Uncharacterized protein n=1 Tax=Rhodococcus erythropolis TaxID=1833 RepID=A0A8I1D5V8_RHOER|nr:hypothetical protein [Rhodococcus erythropolis]MBH5141869.1 hypothetical protein [Rhodococcus erythropolis]
MTTKSLRRCDRFYGNVGLLDLACGESRQVDDRESNPFFQGVRQLPDLLREGDRFLSLARGVRRKLRK